MKKTIFVLLSCMIFASILGSNAFADSPADYEVTGLFDGGSEFLTGIYYKVLDTFGICNYDSNGNKYKYITAATAEIRCKHNTLAGGNLVFYVILPIVLAFLMFWGILKKVNIFDDNIQKYMAVALALVIAPLGIYRILFISLMSLLASGTVFLLYIFLFVLMLGWGYRNMYAKGLEHKTMGDMHIDSIKRSHEVSKNIDQEIGNVQNEIADISSKQGQLILGKKKAEQNAIKIGKKYLEYEGKLKDLNDRLSLMIAHRDKQLKDAHENLKGIMSS